MRSLFLKIFLWFWMAMALVGLALLAATISTQPEPDADGTRTRLGDALAIHAQAAASIYERGGRDALRSYLTDLRATNRLRLWLFDRDGRELSGRTAPQAVLELASKTVRSQTGEETVFSETNGRIWGAHRVVTAHAKATTANGTSNADGANDYVVVGQMRRAAGSENAAPIARPRGRGGLRFLSNILGAGGDSRVRALRLLAVFLTAGLVCYGLARYLTAPLVDLRAATRRLASGDLSARVARTSRRSEAEGEGEPSDKGQQAATSRKRFFKKRARHDEIADLGHDFDLMAERIEILVKSQNRLLGDISHELRSPLARLGLALELARRHSGTEATPALDRIEREAARLNALIGQLLTLSLLEGAANSSDTSDALGQSATVDLNQLLREIVADADFEARSQDRKVVLTSTHAQEQTCRIQGNADLLRSAIENVIRNAMRYAPPDTSVEVELQRINETRANSPFERADDFQDVAQNEPCWAVITVRDCGVGVPPESLSDLFRPFYRVADARDRQSGGVGLGLAITHRAARLHGGSVQAQNAPDGGLLVEIRLPLATTKIE